MTNRDRLSPRAMNVLTLLLLHSAKELYPDSFAAQHSGELTPFPEYIANNDANARSVFAGFAELWEFAGLEPLDRGAVR